MAKVNKNILITITAEFATDFQEEVGMGSLKMMINGWEKFMQANHKKNKVEVTFREKE